MPAGGDDGVAIPGGGGLQPAPGIIVLVSDNEVEAVSAAAAFGVVTVVRVPTEEACCPSP